MLCGVREWYLGTVVFFGGMTVWGENDDVISSLSQALYETLEAVLHTAHMAERTRLLQMPIGP